MKVFSNDNLSLVSIAVGSLLFLLGLFFASGFQPTTGRWYGGQFVIIMLGYVANDLVLILVLTVKDGKMLLFGKEGKGVSIIAGSILMVGIIVITSGVAAWMLNIYETQQVIPHLSFPWNQIVGVLIAGTGLGLSLHKQLLEK